MDKIMVFTVSENEEHILSDIQNYLLSKANYTNISSEQDRVLIFSQHSKEMNDMDKLMRLTCRGNCGTVCRTCSADGLEYPKKKEKREQIRKGCVKLYEICEELSLSCIRAAWDTDGEGMWQEQYKGIDDWELREAEDFYENAAA